MQDLTSTRIIDRASTITSFAACQESSNRLVALVYDQARIILYNTLDKEVERKFRFKSDTKTGLHSVKAICFKNEKTLLVLSIQNSTLMIHKLATNGN